MHSHLHPNIKIFSTRHLFLSLALKTPCGTIKLDHVFFPVESIFQRQTLAPWNHINKIRIHMHITTKIWLQFIFFHVAWGRHQMETFSASLALCAGNSPVPGEIPTQRPVTRSFDVYFDLRPNKRLSKGEAGDLRRHRVHYDVTVMEKIYPSFSLMMPASVKYWCLESFNFYVIPRLSWRDICRCVC